ncbi:hypothetical protein [Candidatus Ichthyocystis hellenicum]|uniref:hypothetical protein n=1 Tax=Candidatus Ichthyocystis hellenicum TaxID=1561003 RepID=UPI000B846D67|nr:hypothetical protein [Candidatus Ichthyocystis hellenicum]
MRAICAMCFGVSTGEAEDGASSGNLSPHVSEQDGDQLPVGLPPGGSLLSISSTSNHDNDITSPSDGDVGRISRLSSYEGEQGDGSYFNLPVVGSSSDDLSLRGSSTNYDNDISTPLDSDGASSGRLSLSSFGGLSLGDFSTDGLSLGDSSTSDSYISPSNSPAPGGEYPHLPRSYHVISFFRGSSRGD